MPAVDEVEQLLSGRRRTVEDTVVDLVAVQQHLAAVEDVLDRLATDADLRADPRYHELMTNLLSERSAAQARWGALLWELRCRGGVVTWQAPDDAIEADGEDALADALSGPAPELAAQDAQEHDAGLGLVTEPVAVASPPHTDAETEEPACFAMPRGVPANQGQIDALVAAFRAGPPAASVTSLRSEVAVLRSVLSQLGKPGPTKTAKNVRDEVGCLEQFTMHLYELRELSAEMHLRVVNYLVARGRRLQEPPAVRLLEEVGLDRALDALFSRWSLHRRTHQPGFVHGLSRSHIPEAGTWAKEATELWAALSAPADEDVPEPNAERAIAALSQLLDAGGATDQVVAQLDVVLASGVAQQDQRLVRLLALSPDVVKLSRFRTLRRAIRDAEVADDDEAETVAALPPDWPYWSVVQDKRALVLGGVPREHARQRIEQAFGMAELLWPSVDHHKQLDSLAQRVRAGGLDLVVVLQSLTSHKATGKLVQACQDVGVPFVPVERGYGVARIKRAIEEHVGGLHVGARPDIFA